MAAMRFDKTVTIAAPPDEVWRVLEDVETWPTWTASMTSVTRDGRAARADVDSGLAVGETFRVKQPRLPTTAWTVTEVTAPRSFTWVARGPGVRTTATHVVEPAGVGSEVRLTLDQGGPLGAVLGLVTGGLTRRYLDLEANGLKARVEQAR
jgi:uncharacterized protein YndB with AHSA1/START domain